jgi:hypothetical protein
MSRHKILTLFFALCLVISLLTACKHQDKLPFPSRGLYLAMEKPVIKSITDYGHIVKIEPLDKGDLNPAIRQAMELEIRNANNQRQVIKVRLANNAPNIVSLFTTDNIDPAKFPPGEYNVAISVAGVRASNVTCFTIDPNFDVTKNPPVAVDVLEPHPLTSNFQPVIRLTGLTGMDQDLESRNVLGGGILVDGHVYVPRMWGGGVWIPNPGEQRVWIPDFSYYISYTPSDIRIYEIMAAMPRILAPEWLLKMLQPLFQFNPNKKTPMFSKAKNSNPHLSSSIPKTIISAKTGTPPLPTNRIPPRSCAEKSPLMANLSVVISFA